MIRERFKEVLRNLHFSDNAIANNEDRGNKVRFLTDHFNKAFSPALSDSEKQSIDEHMVKFKGRSSMKQYIKQKPIQWDLKFWLRCDSKTGYLYQLDLYFEKKGSFEQQLGEHVVIELSKALESTHCTLYFDNFFNSPG